MPLPGYNTPKLTEFLNGNKRVMARVIDIVDGDTIFIVFLFPSTNLYLKFDVRIVGIDCCESHGENRELGQLAKMFSQRFFTGMNFTTRKSIQNHLEVNEVLVEAELAGIDKYGRLLATIYKDNINYGDAIKDAHLAYPYFGKTKLTTSLQRVSLLGGESSSTQISQSS